MKKSLIAIVFLILGMLIVPLLGWGLSQLRSPSRGRPPTRRFQWKPQSSTTLWPTASRQSCRRMFQSSTTPR